MRGKITPELQQDRLAKGKDLFDVTLDAFACLQNCYDFVNERSIVQVMSPLC